MIETKRLNLNKWRQDHFLSFAKMHADPEVMADLAGVIDRDESFKKFNRYCQAEKEHNISRWAVETKQGEFIGYVGIMPRMDSQHPLGKHYEIGWRFMRKFWGNGYATESARAALDHAITQRNFKEILSYTSADNLRSQAVMERLGLRRTASLDFILHQSSGIKWKGLVWAAITKAATR